MWGEQRDTNALKIHTIVEPLNNAHVGASDVLLSQRYSLQEFSHVL